MDVDLVDISKDLYSRTKVLCGSISSIDMFRIDYKLENAASRLTTHLSEISNCSMSEEIRHLIKAYALIISINDYLGLVRNQDNTCQIEVILEEIKLLKHELTKTHPEILIM